MELDQVQFLKSLWLAVPLALVLFCAQCFCAPPALRDQVSLNGAWAEGGQVPLYVGETFDAKTYRRDVLVPADWTGKRVFLVFQQVNYIADVLVDGKLVANHVGGFIPFSVDLTGLVSPGKSFSLEVRVKSSTQKPYVDDKGKALWPVGTYKLDGSYAGIVDDVWLRAYGPVAIHDAFIKTSLRNHSLCADYTLTNHDAVPRTVSVLGEVFLAGKKTVVKKLAAGPVTLQPGETRTLTASTPWTDPKLWMPDSPVLYHLVSCVREGKNVIDRETRRFGFREIWIAGNQFVLNGIRCNLWGDSIPRVTWIARPTEPDRWPAHADMLLHDLNMRIIRWHMFPPPQYLLDVADEKGLLMIVESSLYARPIYTPDHTTLIANTKTWLPPWVIINRNHPSVFMWSAENECGWMHADCMGKTPLSDENLLSLGDVIRKFDPTRPIVYEGDGALGDVADWHYPEAWEGMPRRANLRSGSIGTAMSIYSWGKMGIETTPKQLKGWTEGMAYGPYLDPKKPTGFGEFLFTGKANAPDIYWWHGTWSRGLRYVGYTNIRPFMGRWAWTNDHPEARRNFANSFNPVALFDKDYDDLGIAPLMKHEYPEVAPGAVLDRTLVLYNDEYSDEKVAIEVSVRSGDKTFASGKKTLKLQLGEHVDIPCSFQVPLVPGQELKLVLTTNKGGKQKFSEEKIFKVAGAESTAKTSKTVTFGQPRPPRLP